MQAGEDRKHTIAIARAILRAATIAAEIQILTDREIGKYASAFRHMDETAGDDGLRLLVREIMALEIDRAGPCPHDARQRAIKRRLSDPVRTEHRHDLAGYDRQVDPAQNLRLVVAGAEVAHLEQSLDAHATIPIFAAAPCPR